MSALMTVAIGACGVAPTPASQRSLGDLPTAGPMSSRGIDTCPPPPFGSRIVEVSDAAALTRALAAAQPDDWIHLAPGRYDGRFTAAVNGTSSSPIVVCGSRGAVLDGGGIDVGYGFHLTGANWILAGFTVTGSQKGIVLDGARHDVLEDLEVFGIGDEGVHFRAFSTDNTLERSFIHDVGRLDADAGEGVYVGSAWSHWGQFSGGHPDASDRNRIVANTIGPNTTAENVDVKEGTTGTLLEGNVFDGTGMTAADSWVDVKGNGAMVVGNSGHRTPLDGFQTHVVVPGWGDDNLFSDNVADVAGPGLGFRIDLTSSGNVVTCDNRESGAQAGLANVSCTKPKPSAAVSSLRSNPVATP